MGEGVLRQWASEVGIVLNKSADHDATGWDFILEWTLEHETRPFETPIDLAPSPLRCIIQVKSTDRRLKSLQVELSNWHYLIRNPLPAFFLVLEFSRQSQCQNAHLIHLDEAYIAQVQKRLRAISTQTKRPQLNRKKMRFTWDKTDALPSLDGPGLQTAIVKHLPDGIDAYIRRKEESCASVGYEAGRGEFRFTTTFPTDVDIDQHLVGAHNSMGIAYHPFQDSEECHLSVLQQSAKLILMAEDTFQNHTRLSLHASINRKKLCSTKLDINTPVPPSLLKWANLVHDAWMLARHFGVEHEVKLVVGSLARDYERISLASSFITNYSKD